MSKDSKVRSFQEIFKESKGKNIDANDNKQSTIFFKEEIEHARKCFKYLVEDCNISLCTQNGYGEILNNPEGLNLPYKITFYQNYKFYCLGEFLERYNISQCQDEVIVNFYFDFNNLDDLFKMQFNELYNVFQIFN